MTTAVPGGYGVQGAAERLLRPGEDQTFPAVEDEPASATDGLGA